MKDKITTLKLDRVIIRTLDDKLTLVRHFITSEGKYHVDRIHMGENMVQITSNDFSSDPIIDDSVVPYITPLNNFKELCEDYTWVDKRINEIDEQYNRGGQKENHLLNVQAEYMNMQYAIILKLDRERSVIGEDAAVPLFKEYNILELI